jgi:two-component system response regulator YesN
VLGLLVVDDEYSIRDGIANAIPWEKHGIRVVGQAADGTEALELCQLHRPDIVITDVMMDGMSGLDLAEALRCRMPGVRVIVISGHDDFEFLRRAVELKVVSYVLKPIDPSDLVECVTRTARELEEERRAAARIAAMDEHMHAHRESLLQRFVSNLVDGVPDTDTEIRRLALPLGIPLASRRYMVAALRVDAAAAAARQAHEAPRPAPGRAPGPLSPASHDWQPMIAVLETAREIVGGTWECLAAPCGIGEVVLVIGATCVDAAHYHDPRRIQDRDSVVAALERVLSTIKAELGLEVTAGAGRWYPFPRAFAQSCREARASLEHRLSAGPGCVIRFEDVVTLRPEVFLYPVEQERRILALLEIEAGNGLAEREVESFFRDLESQHCLLPQARGAAFQLLAVLTRALLERGSHGEPLEAMRLGQERIAALSTFPEFISFFQAFTREALTRGEEERKTGVKAVIRLAQEYVLENFGDPLLSQTSIAEHLRVNPSYFSALYKKETGESYVEFVTRLRIGEAKRRLRSTNMRVQEVGRSVGYLNAQYFCTLFRKTAGMSPADFRNAQP